MEKAVCCTCFKPKATLTCGLCKEPVCKYCAQFLQEDSFLLLPEKPEEMKHDTFCGPCFQTNIAPALEAYNSTVERAKEVLIFTKDQYKETRFIPRDEDAIEIKECDDRDEVIMRLAFQAAQNNFNGVVDVQTESKKIRNGAYQTTRWVGSGIPAHINSAKLVRDKSFQSKPN